MKNVQGTYLVTIPCSLAGTGVFNDTDWLVVLICQVVLSTSVLVPGGLFRLLLGCELLWPRAVQPQKLALSSMRWCGVAIRRLAASNSPEDSDTRRTFLLQRLLTHLCIIMQDVHRLACLSTRSQMLFSGTKVSVRSVQEAMNGVCQSDTGFMVP